MPRTASGELDGRAPRMVRSRQALCDAFLDLVLDGNLRPGAGEIAERAGLSRRSLFHHFKDLAELYDAAYEVGMRRAAPLWKDIPPELPVSARLAMLVDTRCKILEITLPFHWELTARALVGPAQRQARESAIESLKEQCRGMRPLFGEDLDHLPVRERSEVLQALATAISPPTWGYLRASLGMSYRAARGVVARSLRAILRDVGVDAGNGGERWRS